MYSLPASVGWEMKFVHSKNFGCGALFIVRKNQLRIPRERYGHYSIKCPHCGRRVIIPRKLIPRDVQDELQSVLKKKPERD